jgi:hypothetical protein
MDPLPAQRSAVAPRMDVDEQELQQPNFLTVLKLILHTVLPFVSERPGQIIGSSFLLLMLWGTHGNLELLKLVLPGWRGPGVDAGNRPRLIPGLPWDDELISFVLGFVLLVLIPMALIVFVYKQPLRAFGLGLPPPGKRKLAVQAFLFLTLPSGVGFYFAAQNPDMTEVYPFFRAFSNVGQFLAYELVYLLFFIAIEFAFRGYLLFGLAGTRDTDVGGGGDGLPGVYFFGRYALMIQMLSYTAWHLGKPLPELWGTVVWGLAAGAVAYAVRSIWPVVLSHWLLNVVLDAVSVLTAPGTTSS